MLTIYKASAGSGKTYNLALSYIRHLLGYRTGTDGHIRPYKGDTARNHRSILAITFTNAATEEMKTRIVKRLAQLAQDPASSDYIQNLTDLFGVDADVIRQAARHALSELLYDYSNFFVSTIDSFFQTVLRTFAREVDQQGDYELSLEQKTIIPEVIALMLEELNRMPDHLNSPLYRWIVNKSISTTEAGKAPNFFDREGALMSNLAQEVDNSMEEVYHSYGHQLDDYLADPSRLADFISELEQRIKTIRSTVKSKARAIENMLKANEFDGINSIFSRVVKLGAQGRPFNSADFEKKTFISILDDGKKVASGAARFRKKLPHEVQEELFTAAQDYCIYVTTVIKTLDFYELLLDGATHLQFIALFRSELAKYLRENNTLLISDTGELLKRIISDQEMPFIYERLGMRLTSLLIDEFQDTSKLQWHNLKPLITNSISQGESLIIGDVKQSIYRFRNSDSSLLDHQVQEDKEIEPFVIHRGTAPVDNTNRRSAHDIVRFNNTFFHYVAEQMHLSPYGGVIQELDPKKNEPASISITISTKTKDALDKEKNLAWRMNSLAEKILDQHERGYRWKDIAILVGTHAQGAEVITYFLEHYPQIRLLSNESLLLSSSPAVRTIMSVLALVARDVVENPRIKASEDGGDPDEANTTAIHDKNDLTTLLTRFNYHRSRGLTHQDALKEALEQVEGTGTDSLKDRVRNIREKKSTNLVALIENIIAAEISEAERKNQIAFLTALQDRATAHCLGPDPSVAAFIRAYELNVNKWAIKAPNLLDAVKVMTIHASKGLEWPCVHVPFANWKFNNEKARWFVLDEGLPAQKGITTEGFDPAIVPPILRLDFKNGSILFQAPSFSKAAAENKAADELDNLNKLYVAFTRAGRELNVLFQSGIAPGPDYTIGQALTFFTNFNGAEITDPRMMPITITQEEETEAHGPLTVFNYQTGGALARYDAAEKDTDEVEVKSPYIAIPRPELGNLIAIEDLATIDDLNIGIEQPKEVADEREAAQAAISSAVYKAAVRGIHLHSVLADMETIHDLDRALNRLKISHKIADDVMDKYRTILEDAFAKTPRARQWFDPANKVWNEQSFFDPEADEKKGQVLRPDRIVQRPDGSIVVVDYKFVNRPTDQQQEEFHRQVSGYVTLLMRMGFSNVSGAIWYPKSHRIMDVKP